MDSTGNTAVYRESIFMGYRGFDQNGTEPQYPFGFGLSFVFDNDGANPDPNENRS